ncbi:MAG: tetratricopeptide repeat protein [Alphaproteobacteria bacterium]|nr:MAG: tetratricopeptide repeat protein [Alphaproteobacteria bacterium]
MNTKGLEDFFVDNWKAVAGAIAAVVVLIAGYAIWNEMHEAREARATDALYEAQKIARTAADEKKIPEADAALQKVSTEFSGTRAAFEAESCLQEDSLALVPACILTRMPPKAATGCNSTPPDQSTGIILEE